MIEIDSSFRKGFRRQALDYCHRVTINDTDLGLKWSDT